MRFTELPLSAQTAYAELFEQTRAFEVTNALAGLTGSFQKLTRKGQDYWYFAYRDLDRKVRMAYVGPNDKRVLALVERFGRIRRDKPLAPQAQAALALGCAPTAPKHFRIIKRLSEYGFFRAGGVLIGTHAFLAMGNLLGIRWREGAATLDVDFAHAEPVHLPHLCGKRHRTAPHRPAPLCAQRKNGADGARWPDPSRPQGRLPGRQLLAGRWHQGHLDSGALSCVCGQNPNRLPILLCRAQSLLTPADPKAQDALKNR